MNGVVSTGVGSSVVSVLAGIVMSAAGPVDRPINSELIQTRLPRIEFLGGPYVRHPRVVTITFSGDDPRVVTRLQQFGNTITRTKWWREVSEGYCVNGTNCIGDGQKAMSVVLDDALPGDVHAVDVSAILRRHAIAGRLGTMDGDSVLLVYLPGGIRLKDALVEHYCDDGPRAFHRTLRFAQKTIGYAVVPRCGDETALTATASHELLETVTSPDTSRPGFAFRIDSRTRGFTAAGNEVVDPCGLITKDMAIVDSSFVVRRAWSNRAASEGRDPCVPSASERPYVAMVPDTQVIRLVNPGDSASLVLRAASDRPVKSWRVRTVDVTGAQLNDRYVDLELDRAEVGPGDRVTLRISLRRLPPTRLIVGMVSTLDDAEYLWPLEVIGR